MEDIANKNVSSKKWTLLIIFHNLGCTFVKMFEFGPLLFPYQYRESSFLRDVIFFLVAYLLVQYVLIHLLLGNTDSLRSYHFRLLQVNLCISISSVLTLSWLARGEVYATISLTKYIFAYEGASVVMLLASTIIALIRTKRLKMHG